MSVGRGGVSELYTRVGPEAPPRQAHQGSRCERSTAVPHKPSAPGRQDVAILPVLPAQVRHSRGNTRALISQSRAVLGASRAAARDHLVVVVEERPAGPCRIAARAVWRQCLGPRARRCAGWADRGGQGHGPPSLRPIIDHRHRLAPVASQRASCSLGRMGREMQSLSARSSHIDKNQGIHPAPCLTALGAVPPRLGRRASALAAPACGRSRRSAPVVATRGQRP